MKKFLSVQRMRVAATLVAALTSAGAAAAPLGFHFDFSQPNSLSGNPVVHFVNAVSADIVDASFNVIGQHWIADLDATTPAVTLEAMSAYGRNGTAGVGVTGLNALYQPVLVQFATPFALASLILLQDDSRFGAPGTVSTTFLDANGQPVGAPVDYLQNAVSSIHAGPTSGDISAILLSSGKFYRSLDITMADVPEPGTSSLCIAGMALITLAARQRRHGNSMLLLGVALSGCVAGRRRRSRRTTEILRLSAAPSPALGARPASGKGHSSMHRPHCPT